MRKVFLGIMAVAFAASSAMAVDVCAQAKKIIIVDKITAAGKAKVVFVSKDQAAGITKGVGTDAGAIEAQLDFAYDGGAIASGGSFSMALGANDGTIGWLVNKTTVAKYVNKGFPVGGGVKVGVIKPGKLLKVVGKTLGDSPIDVFKSGSPVGSVDMTWVYSVINGAESFRHCGQETDCNRKLIAGDTGVKIKCANATACPVDCPVSPSGAFAL